MNTTEQIHAVRYRSIQHEATTSPLLFRKKARQALRDFSDVSRIESNFLQTKDSTAMHFFNTWQSELAPNKEIVSQSIQNKRLLSEVKKSYLFSEDDAHKLLRNMAKNRTNELEKEFVASLYSPSESTARKVAARFVARSADLNSQHVENYVSYDLYAQVAKQNNMVIYDSNAWLLARISQGFQEQAQIKRFARLANKRIKNINTLTADLEAHNNGSIASLFALDLNLVTIRSSHQKYEKALTKLSETDRKSAAKRYALYNEETSALRAAYLDTVAGIDSLQDIQQAAKEIDTVLMRVFDLNTREYNALMVRLKEYRDLTRERLQLKKSLQVSA